MPRLRSGFKKNKIKGQPLSFQTVHGKLTIRRDMDYCWHCGKMFADMDAGLGVGGAGHHMTNGFKEIVTFTGQASASFEDARMILKKLGGIEICATQIQNVTEEVGADVFATETKESEAIFRAPEEYAPYVMDKDKEDDILYILFDGSAVNTRIQDENGSTWKEMKLGMVFRSNDVIWRKTKTESCIITKKEYVAYFGGVGKFKELLFAAALRAGYGAVKKVVVIGDGAHWIWNLCDECFPDATRILDFYHMAENVHEYAGALYPSDDKKKAMWASGVIRDIKKGQFKKAISKVNNCPLNEVAAKRVVNLSGYLENNKDRVKYDQFSKEGYYIGSGMIEGGNKVVIQKRMKQCGMRWGINGGQFIAALRAKSQSNRWDLVVSHIFNKEAS